MVAGVVVVALGVMMVAAGAMMEAAVIGVAVVVVGGMVVEVGVEAHVVAVGWGKRIGPGAMLAACVLNSTIRPPAVEPGARDTVLPVKVMFLLGAPTYVCVSTCACEGSKCEVRIVCNCVRDPCV
jgi:hypothetical protein